MMLPRLREFSHSNTRCEVLLAAVYRLGRRVALREVSEALAERDRSLAQLRDELAHEAGELRALLNATAAEMAYLQRLDARKKNDLAILARSFFEPELDASKKTDRAILARSGFELEASNEQKRKH